MLANEAAARGDVLLTAIFAAAKQRQFVDELQVKASFAHHELCYNPTLMASVCRCELFSHNVAEQLYFGTCLLSFLSVVKFGQVMSMQPNPRNNGATNTFALSKQNGPSFASVKARVIRQFFNTRAMLHQLQKVHPRLHKAGAFQVNTFLLGIVGLSLSSTQ